MIRINEAPEEIKDKLLAGNNDICVHISVATHRAYVYSVESGIEAIQSGAFIKVPTYTNRIRSSDGYLVPPDKIQGCYSVLIPDRDWIEMRETESTSEKEQKAAEITKRLLKRGLISIPVGIAEITNERIPGDETDICVLTNAKIQVKCDYNAGHKEYGGTGNLFLQISECNPLSGH